MTGRTFVTGDIHQTHDINKLTNRNFPEQKYLTKEDVVIIAGDFGMLWNYTMTKEEHYWLKWMDDRNFTTVFCDGNHENFDLLDNLQSYNKFGADVGYVGHSIFHLRRGNVYRINGKRILAIGGAHSHDRAYRTWGKTMWKQEVISQEDIDKCFLNLAKYNNKVDYVVSHCAPVTFARQAITKELMSHWMPDGSEEMLEQLLGHFEFKRWHFGHYHNECSDPHGGFWRCVYNKIHELE